MYCSVRSSGAFSRDIVGWAIDSIQTTVLVTNALGMAIRRRSIEDGLVIHSDRGVGFHLLARSARRSTNWASRRRSGPWAARTTVSMMTVSLGWI